MEPAELTPSGKVLYAEGEVEYLVARDVRMHSREDQRTGVLTVSSARLVFIGEGVCLALALQGVLSVRARSTGFLGLGRSSVLEVCTHASGADAPVAEFTFGSAKQAEQFEQQLRSRMEAAAAERQRQLAQQKPVPPSFSTTSAGVAGLARAQQHGHAATARTMQQAFADLSALMEHAEKVVALAAKLAERERSGETRDEDERREMDRFRLFGISAPVTRAAHGQAFHTELARELADFAIGPLRASSGVLALTDVYCLFNRARGTELVSPADLVQAARLLERLSLPVRLHSFHSGVMALRLQDRGTAELERALRELADSRPGVSAVDAGLALGISPLLAREYLLGLEAAGALCRDSAAHALLFYPGNVFASEGAARRVLAQLEEARSLAASATPVSAG